MSSNQSSSKENTSFGHETTEGMANRADHRFVHRTHKMRNKALLTVDRQDIPRSPPAQDGSGNTNSKGISLRISQEYVGDTTNVHIDNVAEQKKQQDMNYDERKRKRALEDQGDELRRK